MSSVFLSDDLKVPGVTSNKNFANWIEDNGVHIHRHLHLSESKLGGIGLVFDGANFFKEENSLENDLKILSIPADLTIDYQSLLKLLQTLKERDTQFENVDLLQSHLIVDVLKTLAPSSETEILHCYIIAFKILQNYVTREKTDDIYYLHSPLQRYNQYLDILSSTYTMGAPLQKDSPDALIQKLISNSKTLRDKYDAFITLLSALHEKIDFKNLLPFESFLQLYQAIKSRTLEIPHSASISTLTISEPKLESGIKDELETNGAVPNEVESSTANESSEAGETGDVEKSEDDFYVNVTLVPILDFANHTHDNNAYFDVDLKTNDIILKLKHDRIDKRQFEVTINYSPIESIPHFISSYGFIPNLTKQLDHYQLLELKLDNLNAHVKHGELICKWLRVLPQIQIIYGNNDEVYFNFFNNNLPLLFHEKLLYNETWEDVIKGYEEQGYEVDVEEIINMVQYQEDRYDVINGISSIGVKYNQEPIEDLQEIIESITGSEDFDYERLILAAIELIMDNINRKVLQLEFMQVKNNFDRVTQEYNQYLNKVLQLIIAKHENDPSQLILPLELANEEWEGIEYRSTPNELWIEE